MPLRRKARFSKFQQFQRKSERNYRGSQTRYSQDQGYLQQYVTRQMLPTRAVVRGDKLSTGLARDREVLGLIPAISKININKYLKSKIYSQPNPQGIKMDLKT